MGVAGETSAYELEPSINNRLFGDAIGTFHKLVKLFKSKKSPF